MKSSGKSIIVGVTGSIAAYKAVELVRLLKGAGHDVRVIQTPAGRRFVGEVTFEAISGNTVAWDQFQTSGESSFTHIDYSASDLMIVAPATATTLGKMAAGIADNLLLATFLAFSGSVMVCPAMNNNMWENQAVQGNIDLLKKRGVILVSPETGELACGQEGVGRLAEPREIFDRAQSLLGDRRAPDLSGLKVLVTAGGTREPIDSVRYIANRSSGKMGFSIAEAACERGAEVTVVNANCSLPRNPQIKYIDITTSDDLFQVLEKEYKASDLLVMAAAVSDYKVSVDETTGKLKRSEVNRLHLVPTADIVSGLEKGRNGKKKIGFAAEHGRSEIERARSKLKDKGLDMIVFNDISRADIGFESDNNEITIMAPGKDDLFIEKTSKKECADIILDQIKKQM